MLKFKWPARWMAGTAMVLLSALSACGGDNDTSIYQPPTPASALTVTTIPTAATTGTAVTVSGISASNGTALTVDWGDGTTADTLALTATSDSHTYTTASSPTYTITVKLTGTSTITKTGTITVTAAAATVAATVPTGGTVGTAVNITGIATTNATGLSVNWGDGTTADTLATSATTDAHTYTTAGTYSVVLTATGAGATGTLTKSIVIANVNEPLLTTATLPTTGTVGTAVNITGISETNGTALTLNCGDGSGVQTESLTATALSCTYTTAGSYTITLTLTGTTGTTSSVVTGPVTISAASVADLFFNEYVLGASNAKAVQIYNPTGHAVDLSYYVVEEWANGYAPTATTSMNTGTVHTPYTVHLTGTLAAGKTVVIANNTVTSTGTNATLYTAATAVSGTIFFNGQVDTLSTSKDIAAFNGNDTLQLLKSTAADVVTNAGTSTQTHTACVRDSTTGALDTTTCSVIDSIGQLGYCPAVPTIPVTLGSSSTCSTTNAAWANASGTVSAVSTGPLHALHRLAAITHGSLPTVFGTSVTDISMVWDPSVEWENTTITSDFSSMNLGTR